MAKLIRPTQIKIFGSTALAAELTEFGGSVPSTDINTILNNAASDRGWGTVGANGFPPMEWFNALGYGLSYYSAYLMQDGIPKWAALQNYYVNSYAVGSDGKIYRSKTGVDGTPNVGNDPVGDTTNWENSSDVAGSIHAATSKTTLADADEFGIYDSITGILKKVSQATLKTYFDTLYLGVSSVLGFANMPAGSVIQVANFTTGAFASTTSLIPLDNTIPQITEGAQFMSRDFTPKKANSKLKVDVVVQRAISLSATDTIALFRDSGINAIGSCCNSDAGANYIEPSVFTVYIDAVSTNLTTFTVRAGCNVAGTFYFNGFGGSQYMGGSLASSITITEIAQ